MKNLNAYLIFNGNCRQAMTFYQECLGGVLYLSTYGQSPGTENLPPEKRDRIIHGRLTIKSLVLMASDAHPAMTSVKEGNNFFVSINADDRTEAEKIFSALGRKGKIEMPLQETFFSLAFGMLTDQFNIKWMVNAEKPKG